MLSPQDECPDIHPESGKMDAMEAYLLELQADIINREELLAEKERYLQARALELNEREALLEAHKKVFEAKNSARRTNLTEKESSEMLALEALRAELKTQEISLKEARRLLHEREAYVEECENELVEKSLLLTEREARLEQREEDVGASENRLKA